MKSQGLMGETKPVLLVLGFFIGILGVVHFDTVATWKKWGMEVWLEFMLCTYSGPINSL